VQKEDEGIGQQDCIGWDSFRLAIPKQQGVCYTVGLAIYILKYFKAKEELWKLKYLTMKKYNLQKIL